MAGTKTKTVAQEQHQGQRYVELTDIRIDGKPFDGIAVLHANPEDFTPMYLHMDPEHITKVSHFDTPQFGCVGYILQTKKSEKIKVNSTVRLVEDPDGLVAKLVAAQVKRF
ncbi:MAG: hypothetical protein HYT16_02955 [DPANN group archaeon]|nr:hypothetical protein [DPANN group archaeon]